ncbi:DUF2911 domain-containing protein [Solitalea canadensis]|uniref:DUF2911 domain-containing protein n=1 Tax=Solitalea canadensis (strain ATCC 29591 / DSM 3403 / JCM 21819 / LMG 8368 / NBRC 15130 / NCIMB 12057 / USAM 9D) TaxID=929556 RepID=H8KN05_SOLCM|nr:DUF2911 domain-containing protein [Solitalea canadensis]AFD09084.1 Protein of unknown function (DUF2911) [Solitalea canadensis DSM 3403]
MRKTIITLLAAILISAAGSDVMAQGIKMPAPSPTQTLKQDFALSTIELTYSRPSMKGRKIYGDLVPFGKLWRTGANAATKIKFGEDVKLNGVAVPAGEYVIYTIPTEGDWEVVINKGLKNWGIDGYKQEEDVARFKAKTRKLPFSVETLTMTIDNVKPTSADIDLMWDNVEMYFTVTADIDSKIMASIDEAMKGEKKPYFQAATYYYETNRDLKQALTWADEAVKAQPDAFWVMHLKAKIQYKMKDYKGAITTAEQSKAVAAKANNNDYVALNDKLIAEAKGK